MRKHEWRVAVAAETLLAKIDGCITTDRLQLEIYTAFERQKDARYHVIKGMTVEEVEAIVARQAELQERAARSG